MAIVTTSITLDGLRSTAAAMFGDMVKAVVDVKRGIMAVDGERHADEDDLLLQRGSQQASLWGIDLYPDLEPADWIEFDSLINLRPARGNRSRGVAILAQRRTAWRRAPAVPYANSSSTAIRQPGTAGSASASSPRR